MIQRSAVFKLAFGLVAFCLVHFVASYCSFGLAFGFGESGSLLGMPFAVALILLVPLFFVLEAPLDILLPDNIAINVAIILNGIVWWSLITGIVHYRRWSKKMLADHPAE